jgi:uncharacterized repeat protein (TIGR03803 family)
MGAPLVDSAGNVFGMTYAGGIANCVAPFGCGTVFKLDASGNKTVLYEFTGSTDGGSPSAGLIEDKAGNLYGTTTYGGYQRCGVPSACGTVFEVDASGKFRLLYRFQGGADGANPQGALVRDSRGNLYGTTVSGGVTSSSECTIGCGTVFKINSAGKESILYRFTGGADGLNPYGALVLDNAGNLYGTTLEGGDPNCFSGLGCGVVFKVDASGNETVLHAFDNGSDAQFPQAGLVMNSDGFMYGATNGGGTSGIGAVYKIDTAGNESVIYNFVPNTGGFPAASLVHDAKGNLYGVTFIGGLFNSGTVFKLNSAGDYTLLYSFGENGGANPEGLTRSAAGDLYINNLNGSFSSSALGTVVEIAP